MKTTIELSGPLLARAKRLAAAQSTTLRELVEAGLRQVLEERSRASTFVLRDASVGGKGLDEEWKGASWDELRDASYRGRGT
jgi:hypothetical protein